LSKLKAGQAGRYGKASLKLRQLNANWCQKGTSLFGPDAYSDIPFLIMGKRYVISFRQEVSTGIIAKNYPPPITLHNDQLHLERKVGEY